MLIIKAQVICDQCNKVEKPETHLSLGIDYEGRMDLSFLDESNWILEIRTDSHYNYDDGESYNTYSLEVKCPECRKK